MKLVIAIIKDVDALNVSDALVARNFRVTRVASTGGFLRRGNVTLLIGVEATALPEVFEIIKGNCRECADTKEHKATVFVLPAEDFVQLG